MVALAWPENPARGFCEKLESPGELAAAFVLTAFCL